MTDPIAVLTGVPMFSRLAPEVIQELASQTTMRDFQVGDVIAQRGSENDGLFVVAEGEMEVYRGDRVFKVLGPGDVVGDMSLIDGERHMVDVVATEPGHGVFLSGGSFRVVIKHYPEAALEMMKTLVGRIRETVGWLEGKSPSDLAGK